MLGSERHPHCFLSAHGPDADQQFGTPVRPCSAAIGAHASLPDLTNRVRSEELRHLRYPVQTDFASPAMFAEALTGGADDMLSPQTLTQKTQYPLIKEYIP